MALTNWNNNTCGKCGFVHTADLPKHHCELCGKTGCPVCMGNQGADDDGNMKICKDCAMEQLPERLKTGRLTVAE